MRETEENRYPVAASGKYIAEIRNLKKSFGEKQVLKDISFFLHPNENLVVMGRSGTGKSVLIKCMAGLIDIDDGEIKLFGVNVDEAKKKELNELRKRIGFLFQGGALYDSMTVRENLEFPIHRHQRDKDEKEVEEMVRSALQSVGLPEALEKMPSELSGGMRKRISLARTIIMQPELILYDEPTTGLDTITGREISELILDIREQYNTTSLIITHDLECAKITGDRILILDEGIIIAEGKYEDLERSDNMNVKAFFERRNEKGNT